MDFPCFSVHNRILQTKSLKWREQKGMKNVRYNIFQINSLNVYCIIIYSCVSILQVLKILVSKHWLVWNKIICKPFTSNTYSNKIEILKSNLSIFSVKAQLITNFNWMRWQYVAFIYSHDDSFIAKYLVWYSKKILHLFFVLNNSWVAFEIVNINFW